MKRVIVQDTDNDLLETMTIILEEANYAVLPVLRYKDVIAQIKDFDPLVVLLDFKLSGEECISLCQKIKKEFPLIPVVVMSCNINIHKEYATAGFDDYIAKPFDIDHLVTVLDKYTRVPS